jgi:hypothetical protein
LACRRGLVDHGQRGPRSGAGVGQSVYARPTAGVSNLRT